MPAAAERIAFPVRYAGEKLLTLGKAVLDCAPEVMTLYSDTERQDGYIIGHRRDGVEAKIPLMRCSIGVMELPAGVVVSDIDRISAEIALVKALAKKSSTGLSVTRFGEELFAVA